MQDILQEAYRAAKEATEQLFTHCCTVWTFTEKTTEYGEKVTEKTEGETFYGKLVMQTKQMEETQGIFSQEKEGYFIYPTEKVILPGSFLQLHMSDNTEVWLHTGETTEYHTHKICRVRWERIL